MLRAEEDIDDIILQREGPLNAWNLRLFNHSRRLQVPAAAAGLLLAVKHQGETPKTMTASFAYMSGAASRSGGIFCPVDNIKALIMMSF
jgi:hypothetical protein